jgi:hypothetical protein
VALDEALTLENLGMVLHGEGSLGPERRMLLAGYLSLKREVTVELLSACCEHASEAELDRLGQACFALEDAARWGQERSRWVALEFELLRFAAVAAKRPGHLLLIQSLERAFRAMARRLLPYLDSQSVAAWARCAMHTLSERQVQPLRTQLTALLEARDERMLAALAPTSEAEDVPEDLGHGVQALESAQSVQTLVTATQAPKSAPSVQAQVTGTQAPESVQSIQAQVAGTQAPESARSAQASWIETQVLEVSPSGLAPSTETQAPEGAQSAPEPGKAEVSGAHCANLYGCQTGSCEVPPPAPLPAPGSTAPWSLAIGAIPNAAPEPGLLHVPATDASSSPEGWEPCPPLHACPRPGAACPEGGHSSKDLPRVESMHGSPDR